MAWYLNCCSVTKLYTTLCDPMDYQVPLSMGFPGKNPGVGCHCLLQGIFLTQESNLGLLHCRQILYHLSYQGSKSRSFSGIPLVSVCFSKCWQFDLWSSASSKPSLYIWKFSVHRLLKTSLKDFEHILPSM